MLAEATAFPAQTKLKVALRLFFLPFLPFLSFHPLSFLPVTPADICLMNVKAFILAKVKCMRLIAFILLPLMGARVDKSSWILMETYL